MTKKSILLGICLLFMGMIFKPLPTYAQAPLKIGLLKNQAPYSYSQVKQAGFEVELAQKLGKKLQRPVKIKLIANQNKLLTDLKQHKIDVALGVNSTVKDRKLKLSSPYLWQKNTLFIQNNGPFKSYDKLIGHYLGVLSTNQQISQFKELGFKVKTYSTVDKLQQALAARKISAGVLSDYQYTTYVQQHLELQDQPNLTPEAQKQTWKTLNAPLITAQPRCLATTNSKLTKQLNQALTTLSENQSLSRLSQRYFQQDLTKQ